jgi:hypothetical protein
MGKTLYGEVKKQPLVSSTVLNFHSISIRRLAMNTYKDVGKLVIAGILFTALIVVFGTVAPVKADESLAIVEAGPSNIIINNISTKNLALTVSGDTGFYAQTDIGAGESMSFVAGDANGPLADGRYKYELMTIPEADGEKLEAQTGSFKIVHGLIVPHARSKSLRP